jgi:hypothetical protein
MWGKQNRKAEPARSEGSVGSAESGNGAQASPAPPSVPNQRRALDAVAVFLLAAIAVLTAWCGFQSSKWGGEMSIAFSQASGARVTATDWASQARDAQSNDLAIWAQWVLATDQGDTQLAQFIEERFSPEFATAFDAWTADGRVERGPFMRDEYVPPGTDEAAKFNELAGEQFDAALVNNQRGDNYSLLTVLFALVLFLTAMSQRDMQPWVRRVLLVAAGLFAVSGLVLMLTFPIKI